MNKQELRAKYKFLRSELSDDDIDKISLEIANMALQLPIWDKTYFHVFLAIKHHKEIDTEYLLHLLTGKDKEIVVSRSNFDTREMTHVLLTDSTRLALNHYGIPEPTNGLIVDPKNIEVVFVPLLAYDKSGHRVGYGKGFYDKFLADCPQAIKVGLSFFDPEMQGVETVMTDVQLDFCITPSAIYRF